MRKFTEATLDFMRRDDGPTAVEYGVMLALIIVVCLAGLLIVGSGSSSIFTAAGSGAGSATVPAQ